METTPQAINEMCQTVCSLHEIYHVLIYLVNAVISKWSSDRHKYFNRVSAMLYYSLVKLLLLLQCAKSQKSSIFMSCTPPPILKLLSPY